MRRRTGLEQTRANQSYKAKCSTLVSTPSQVIDCANYNYGLIYIGISHHLIRQLSSHNWMFQLLDDKYNLVIGDL